MDTNLGGGGLLGSLGRMVTGELLFVVNYTAQQDGALVTFSSDFPGKIIPINLAQGQSMIAQKGYAPGSRKIGQSFRRLSETPRRWVVWRRGIYAPEV